MKSLTLEIKDFFWGAMKGILNVCGEGICLMAKMPPSLIEMPTFRFWPWLLSWAFCKCRPGETEEMTQVGILATRREIWIKFLAPGFGQPQWPSAFIGNKAVRVGALSVHCIYVKA